MDLTGLFAQVLNGLQYGLLLFLISSGLTLVFGVMGVINLAHGSLFMVGQYYLEKRFGRGYGTKPSAVAPPVAAGAGTSK